MNIEDNNTERERGRKEEKEEEEDVAVCFIYGMICCVDYLLRLRGRRRLAASEPLSLFELR